MEWDGMGCDDMGQERTGWDETERDGMGGTNEVPGIPVTGTPPIHAEKSLIFSAEYVHVCQEKERNRRKLLK